MTPSLSQATLPALAHRVDVPGYMRDRVQPGIVHLGLGGFHRAHMAQYTHDLMQRSDEATCWGIVGGPTVYKLESVATLRSYELSR